MSSSFNRTLGIACITTFFQLGVQAQNPAIPQAQSLQPAATSGITSSPSEPLDISKPGKPKLNGNAPQVPESISRETYAALAFPVLKPKSSLVSGKAPERAPDIIASRAASDVSAEVRGRSWAIPPLATRNRVAGEAGAETMIRAAVAEPRISPNNPSIRFRIIPSESKLNGSLFTNPSMDLIGPPASFQATAYALHGITASGIYVRRGVIAADPRVIPIGSVVQLVTPGYSGIYTVQDTGGKIKGKIVDVWVGSSREARIFGRRQIRLHVVRWGKPRRSSK